MDLSFIHFILMNESQLDFPISFIVWFKIRIGTKLLIWPLIFTYYWSIHISFVFKSPEMKKYAFYDLWIVVILFKIPFLSEEMKTRKKSTFVGLLAALNSAKVVYVLSICRAEISIDSKNFNNKKVALNCFKWIELRPMNYDE